MLTPYPVQAHSKRVHKQPHGLPQFRRVEPISITSQDRRRCQLFDLHKEIIPYEEAWNWQKSVVKERKILIEKNEDWSDSVIVLQHQPVFTMGTGSSQENLNFNINDSPYPVYRTERGGEVTYHGPGQLVMYPILNLRYHKMDLHWYLRALEEVVIRVLSSTFAIKASRLEGLTIQYTFHLRSCLMMKQNVTLATMDMCTELENIHIGIFDLIRDQKLTAIGIRVAQWVTYHGLALNVTADLAPFNWIIPCGIRNRRVGSIKSLLKECQPTDEGEASSIYQSDDHHLMEITRNALVKEFSEVFQLEVYHQPNPIFSRAEAR